MNTKQKLELILTKFRSEIGPQQFRFDTFVSGSLNGCGTVCCMAGWFPKLFPKAGIEWKMIEHSFTIQADSGLDIKKHLMMLLNADEVLVSYLFYGSNGILGAPHLTAHTTYDELVDAWAWIIKNYKFVDKQYRLE